MHDSPVTSLKTVSNDDKTEPNERSESTATRHLCAGTYLDRSFRDLVLRKVHNDSRRRVAPSYGFDLVPVVRHAWYAWFLEVSLHVAIAASLIAGVTLGHHLAVVIVTCALGVCFLVRIAGRNLAEALRLRTATVAKRWSHRPGHRLRRSATEEMNKRKRLLKASLVGCVALAVAPVAMSIAINTSLGSALPAAAAIVGILTTCAVVVGVVRQLLLNSTHHASSLRPAKLTRREQVIDEQQTHECVIYQRPEHKKDADPLELLLSSEEPTSPFVGTGKLVNRWLPPMTVQLLRPDPVNAQGWAQREHTTPPFRAHELVDRLRLALRQLGTDPGAERMPDLRVCDRLYVAEPDISTDRSLLTGDLSFIMAESVDNHQTLAHHFLETSAPIASGELVTTVLIRVSLKGRCLSLDVATCALTRTPRDFQRIDAFAEHGVSAVVRSAIRSMIALPVDAVRLWQIAEIPGVLGRAWWAIKDRTHKPRRGVRVGARVAIREKAADDWKNAQLDETTIFDHMKIIEQRVLKATEDFLSDHDVDTSAFERQATSIINSGVLNMGGVTEINESAIGASAQVLLGAASDLKQAASQEKPA